MQNVPKFVLQRLRKTPPAFTDPHPDADLLTAFAEQSLGGDERVGIVAHLSACGECRDVVALALPAIEISAVSIAHSPARIGWLTWPAFRWAAVAAVVLAVTSVGLLQYSHRRNQTLGTIASSSQPAESAPPVPSAMPSSRTEQPSLPVAAPPMQRKQLRTPSPPATRPYESNANKPVLEASGTPQPGPGQDVSAARAQPAIPQSSQQVMVAANSQTVQVESAASAVNTETPAAAAQFAQNQSNLPLQGRNLTSLDVVKAKDAVPAPASSAASPVASPSLPLQTSPSMMLRASPRWMVDPAGALQRSFDGGATWESVDPSRSMQTGQDEAKANKKAAAASDSSSPPPNPVFRAVSANGLEVWAGAAAALYHSSDGGNRWARIVPTDSGTTITGDIISIQFSSSQNGDVKTSTGERWITSNGGLTWGRSR